MSAEEKEKTARPREAKVFLMERMLSRGQRSYAASVPIMA
jgi:hypothetical protein